MNLELTEYGRVGGSAPQNRRPTCRSWTDAQIDVRPQWDAPFSPLRKLLVKTHSSFIIENGKSPDSLRPKARAMVSWFCKIDGIEHGPLTQDKLVRMASQGRIAPDDLVRNELKDKWYLASQVDGLLDETDVLGGSTGRAGEGDDAGSETSIEAQRLLKAFGRNKQQSSADDLPPSERRDDPPPSKTAQRRTYLSTPDTAERKPLSKPQKIVIGAAACAALLLILFPPFVVPYGLGDGGRQRGFLFARPKFQAKVPPAGLRQKLNSSDMIVGDKAVGTKTVSWGWLILELSGVAIVAGVVFLILRTHDEVGPAPAESPKKRKPQTV